MPNSYAKNDLQYYVYSYMLMFQSFFINSGIFHRFFLNDGQSPEVLKFNQLFLKLHWFLCN
jgi:hypothetical protein